MMTMRRYEVILLDGTRMDVPGGNISPAENSACVFTDGNGTVLRILWGVKSVRLVEDTGLPVVHVETVPREKDAIPSFGDELPRIDYRRKRDL